MHLTGWGSFPKGPIAPGTKAPGSSVAQASPAVDLLSQHLAGRSGQAACGNSWVSLQALGRDIIVAITAS